jgi:hypothetical protein
MKPRAGRRRRGPGGFTVVEMAVVGGLTVLLAALLGAVWSNFCRPAIDAAAMCRIAQEANLAARTLAQDMGGSLPVAGGGTGARDGGRLVGIQADVTGTTLLLCFHDPSNPNNTNLTPTWTGPDVVVTYQFESAGKRLSRIDPISGSTVVVANGLSAFQAGQDPDAPNYYLIVLSFQFTPVGQSQSVTYVYTLRVRDPQT